MSDADIIDALKLAVTAIGGITLFFIGRFEYSKSVKVKRAEFLDKLVTEFLNKDTEVARNMLDDYVYVIEENRELDPVAQKSQATPLAAYLRDHDIDPIGRKDEIAVRRSFDKLLDFMTKLSYYLSNNLISSSELQYFRYYIHKIDNKAEVKGYISKYFYLEDFILLFNAVNGTSNRQGYRNA